MGHSRRHDGEPRSRRGSPGRATFPDSSLASREGTTALHLHSTTPLPSLHNGLTSALCSQTERGQTHSEIRRCAAHVPLRVSAFQELLTRKWWPLYVVDGAEWYSQESNTAYCHQEKPLSSAGPQPRVKGTVTPGVLCTWEGREKFTAVDVDTMDANNTARASGCLNQLDVPHVLSPSRERRSRPTKQTMCGGAIPISTPRLTAPGASCTTRLCLASGGQSSESPARSGGPES